MGTTHLTSLDADTAPRRASCGCPDDPQMVARIQGVDIAAVRRPPRLPTEADSATLRPAVLTVHDMLHAGVPLPHQIAGSHHPVQRVRNMLKNLPDATSRAERRLEQCHSDLSAPPDDYADIPERHSRVTNKQSELEDLEKALAGTQVLGVDQEGLDL